VLLFRAALFIFVIGITGLLIGCGSNTEYIKTAATKRGISYSFEYPASYKKSLADTSQNATVIGDKYVVASDNMKEYKEFNILLWNPTPDFPNAKARLDYYTGLFENMGGKATFKERSPIKVSGIDGEMLNYSYTLEGSTESSNNAIIWIAFIDYKGQIVHIAASSAIEVAGEAKADFEHIIKSFKFLN
jgi:hypothetical protein